VVCNDSLGDFLLTSFDRDQEYSKWALYRAFIPTLTWWLQRLLTHALWWDGVVSIRTLILWCFCQLYMSTSSGFLSRDSFKRINLFAWEVWNLDFYLDLWWCCYLGVTWHSLEFWPYFLFGAFRLHRPHCSFDGWWCWKWHFLSFGKTHVDYLIYQTFKSIK